MGFGHSKYLNIWWTPLTPANWSLPKASQVQVHLVLSGFDRLVPAPHPERAATITEYTLFVRLRSEVIEEHGLDPYGPENGVFAAGSATIPVTAAGPGEYVFDLALVTTKDVVFQQNERFPFFGVEVRVHGGESVDARPIRVHVAPQERASYAIVPGFPEDAHEAMRAHWDVTSRCEAAPAGSAGPAATETSARDAPSGGRPALLALLVLMFVAGQRKWRRNGHS